MTLFTVRKSENPMNAEHFKMKSQEQTKTNQTKSNKTIWKQNKNYMDLETFDKPLK